MNVVGAGGSVYIARARTAVLVAVVQPNLSLRGLGGDPTKVVLTGRRALLRFDLPVHRRVPGD